MRSIHYVVSLFAAAALSAAWAPQWRFDVKKTLSGIVALESVVISPTLVLFFDNAANDPMQINNHSAWGALWNLETSTVRPLDVLTQSFCASGAFISNGSMISVGGQPNLNVFPHNPAPDGTTGIRIWEPCMDPTGVTCNLFEDPQHLHLAAKRWYATAVRIYDGGLFIAGGSHNISYFVNDRDPENTFEFYPPRDGGVPRRSQFLIDSLPSNYFPRIFSLPDGLLFMVAGNKTMIYDVDTDTETRLPDIPNGVTVTNPADGSAILLPLSPPHYVPEVLVCGGQLFDTSTPVIDQSSQKVASDQCSRIEVTPHGISRGWQVEHLLEPRVMPEMLHLPNGQVLIANGGRTGYAAFASVGDAVGNSNADHPVLTPEIYTPGRPHGSRISNKGLPTSEIPRLYHSSITLTPQGNFLIAGSNPNGEIVEDADIKYKSEFRVETLDPPYMFVDRPVIKHIPKQFAFGQTYTMSVSIPRKLHGKKLQVSLMDLGFSTHSFHSSARLVFMDAKLSKNAKFITFTTPPNGKVYPPGPAWVYLTVDDVSSQGSEVMMGSGRAPPTLG